MVAFCTHLCQVIGDHANCGGFGWTRGPNLDEPMGLVLCDCLCHGVMRHECELGKHDLCIADYQDSRVRPYLGACDCPCHFLVARAELVKLRLRLVR